MAFLLKFSFPPLMALATGAASPANLSEADLIARYPAVAAATVLFLGVGLVCDVYLLFRLHGYLKTRTTNTAEPLLRVEPKPWTTQDLLFATGMLILAFTAGNSLLALGLKFAHVTEANGAPWFLVLQMLLCGVSVLGMVMFFRRRSTDWTQAVGLRRGSSLHALALGGILFFAVLPPLDAVLVISDKLCHLAGFDDTLQPAVNLLITSNSGVVVALIIGFAVAVAPVFEEFFFRGIAYPALKQRCGAGKALAIVSVAFALAHLHVPSMGPLFVLALGLGLAYELTGSLLAPITMHALFNAANVAMLLYVRAHP